MSKGISALAGGLICLLFAKAAMGSPGQVMQSFPAPGFSPSGLGWDGTSI
jgi:hypothetical protein